VKLISLTPEVAVESSRLPGVFLGDPADRILVATARQEGAILLTRNGGVAKSDTFFLDRVTV
jgi:PIN domain nuclease of toxin-antitoxin system